MCSFEIFFIKSTHLQRFKFFRNMWGEVRLLHFNKVTFFVGKLLKGDYSLQILSRNFSTDSRSTIFEKTPSRIILQPKLSVYYYSIIFNRTGLLLNKSTKLSSIMIYYWKVLVKYLDEIAVGLVRLKRVSLI